MKSTRSLLLHGSTARRVVLGGLAVLTTTGLVTGCTSSQAESANREVSDSITFLEPDFFRTLYPPSAGFYPNGGVVNQITDRLLYQDPETLELSPWIATDMPEVNEDATEYTFDIRTDVSYSDGSPMTAENIVANFDLFGNGDESRILNSSEQISNYDHGEVVDEDTVRFHFSAPAPGFLQAVSGYNAGLLANSTLALDDEGFGPGNATEVIGSGPFVIDSEKLGTDLVLKAREDYDWAPPEHPHQGRARLDEIHYALANEEAMRSGALISDQAQIIRQVSAPVESHLQDKGLKVISHGTNAMNNQIDFRFNHPLLRDIRVRKALIHGVNRPEIIRILFSDSYPLATSTVAATGQGYKDQGDAYEFDPDKARALLDEAGFVPGPDGIRAKDGQRLVLRANHALPQPRSKEVMAMIQQDYRDIGIELKINSGDRATQNAAVKQLDKVQLNHSMVGRADYDAIQSLFSLTNRDAFLNQDDEGNPIDAHLEDLLNQVVSAPEESERDRLVGEVQDYVTEKAYALPLFEEPVVYALQPELKGFAPEAVGRPSFYGAYLEHDQDDDAAAQAQSRGIGTFRSSARVAKEAK